MGSVYRTSLLVETCDRVARGVRSPVYAFLVRGPSVAVVSNSLLRVCYGNGWSLMWWLFFLAGVFLSFLVLVVMGAGGSVGVVLVRALERINRCGSTIAHLVLDPDHFTARAKRAVSSWWSSCKGCLWLLSITACRSWPA